MSRTPKSQFSPGRLALGGRLLLALSSLVFALLLLILLEGALRLAGIGDTAADSRLAYQYIDLPMLVEAERPDGTHVLRTRDPRLPYQEILFAKPERGIRILTFGGSAAAGLGYSPNMSFSRHLERMLERNYPDRKIEVLNLGIVALASRQVVALVEEAVEQYDPDALIVYSGNNEFLELHAEKLGSAQANFFSGVRDYLTDTNLFRVVHRAVRGAPEPPSLAELSLSEDNAGLAGAGTMQAIELSPAEVADVIDEYESNLLRISEAAQRSGTPLLLMTVASNWEWLGRDDLSEGWLEDMVDVAENPKRTDLLAARRNIDDEIASAGASNRYEWLFKRGVVESRLGNWEAARRDYRAAMNQDPHLRRGLDSMAERVRQVARGQNPILVDTIALLTQTTPNGIIGFDVFYDYVHMTPVGSIRVAGFLFDSLRDGGVISPNPGFDSQSYIDREVIAVRNTDETNLALETWPGFGDHEGTPLDRDLWKYARMVESLDRRIQEDPRDAETLIRRGNAYAFELDGGEKAREHYEAALEILGDDPVVRTNLEQVRSRAHP